MTKQEKQPQTANRKLQKQNCNCNCNCNYKSEMQGFFAPLRMTASYLGDRVGDFLVGGGVVGAARGVGCWLGGVGDEDGLLALVIEVDVEDGGAAAVPDLLGDGEAEEDHAFGEFAGGDHGLAEERSGG